MKKINLKTTFWISTAIMAFVILSTDVMAQRGQRNASKSGMGQGNGQGMMQNQRNGEPGQACFEMLDLTADQQAQMKTMRIKHLEKMLPFKNVLREKRAKLQTLRTEQKVDMKAIHKVIDDMADLKANLMKSQEAHKQEVRSILTDEQRVLFDSFKGRRGGRTHGQGVMSGKRGQRSGRGIGR